MRETTTPTGAEAKAAVAAANAAVLAARAKQGQRAAVAPKTNGAAVSQQPKPKAEPKAAKPKAEPRPICSHRKLDGSPCTARVMAAKDGSLTDHCTDHRPPEAHLSLLELATLTDLVAREGNLDDRERAARLAVWFVRQLGWGQVRQRMLDGRLR